MVAEIARQQLQKWRSAGAYYAAAEEHMAAQWSGLIWPMIKDSDFTTVLELAPGHGRNSERLGPLAQTLIVVDFVPENIAACRRRLDRFRHVLLLVNDGVSLQGVAGGDVSFIYSFDSMVHFDSEVVRAYLHEFYRVLRPGGTGFCHHSNYTDNPGGSFEDNPHARNYMSQDLFAEYCRQAGLEVITQRVIDWQYPALDCLTLFRKPVPAG